MPTIVSGPKYAAYLNPQGLNVAVIPMADPVPPGWVMLLNATQVLNLQITIDIDGDPLSDLVERIDRGHKFVFKTGSDIDQLDPVPESPFTGNPPAATGGSVTTAEAQAEVGRDSPVQFVDPTTDLHPAWRRYRDPDQVPPDLKLPEDPSRTVQDLVSQLDPKQTWAVYYEPKKLRKTAKTLPKLDPDDPRPLDREESFGAFSASKTNDILSDHGTQPVNFGRYEGNLRSGWEDCSPGSVPKTHPALIEGKTAQTRDLVKGGGKGAKWAHRQGTSWSDFEPVGRKHWPPYEKPKEQGSQGAGKTGFIRANPRVAIAVAVAAALLIVLLGGTLGVLIDVVVFGGIAALALVYSITHRGFASEAAWLGLGVGALVCLWLWIYQAKAEEATIMAALGLGLAWGLAAAVVAFVLALALSKGRPIFTEESLDRIRWPVAAVIAVAGVLLVFAVLAKNQSVSDNGRTKLDPEWYQEDK